MPSLAPLRRRWGGPLLAGGVGLAVLPIHLAPQLATQTLPEPLASLPAAAVIALSLVNPLVLLVTASLAGALLAHRVGLGAWCAGTAAWPQPRAWAGAALAGLLVAAVLAVLDALWAPWLGPQWAQAVAGTRGGGSALALGLFYGGLAEEVMMRWGLMSLLAWTLHRVLARSAVRPPAALMAVAVLLAAALFAAGHLPALAAQAELTPALVARTLVLNLVGGVAYGILFWRHSLEVAMAAHAATHVGFFILGRLLA